MTEANSRPPSPPGRPIIGHARAFASDPFGFVEESVASTDDVFRMQLLGRDVYVVAHPDYIGTALRNPEAFAKIDGFRVAFGEALLAVEGEQWQRQRRAMEGFFDPSRIGEYAETMSQIAAARLDDWDDGDVIAVDEAMRSVALENLFAVLLGQSLDAEDIDAVAETASALNRWFEPSSWVLPDWLPTPARREFRRSSAALRDRARALLDDAGDDPDDDSLLATLAALSADPDSGFDREEVLDQVVGMLFAGHETTALAMTYALHQIGSHPAVARRFHAEIDDVIDGTATLSELQELTYLDRLVSETLRLYPPVHTLPRVTTEAVDLGPYTLSADAQVLLSVWNMHRDDRFYDDPLAFDPDRWERASPRERGHAFVPFGAGPRVCIGRHFSRLEMKAVLATVGKRYRVDALSDVVVAPQMTSQPAEPVRLRLTERA